MRAKPTVTRTWMQPPESLGLKGDLGWVFRLPTVVYTGMPAPRKQRQRD